MVGFSKIDNKTNINEFLQDGFWDSKILCKDCDNNLGSSYENPIAKIYYDHDGNTRKVGFVKNDNDFSFSAKNLDFNIFYKFILTQLWRMSISKQNGFTKIDLGPYHTEQIRLLLKENSPVTGFEYPIIFLVTPPRIKEIIVIAEKKRYKGYIFYQFKIHQFIYWVFVNSLSHKLPVEIQNKIILKDKIIAYKAPKKLNSDIDKMMIDMISKQA